MKFSTEQMVLAAHVRTLAVDLWRQARNKASDQWHQENPGQNRPIEEFTKKLNASVPFNHFILEATEELERVVVVMLNPRDGSSK